MPKSKKKGVSLKETILAKWTPFKEKTIISYHSFKEKTKTYLINKKASLKTKTVKFTMNSLVQESFFILTYSLMILFVLMQFAGYKFSWLLVAASVSSYFIYQELIGDVIKVKRSST